MGQANIWEVRTILDMADVGFSASKGLEEWTSTTEYEGMIGDATLKRLAACGGSAGGLRTLKIIIYLSLPLKVEKTSPTRSSEWERSSTLLEMRRRWRPTPQRQLGLSLPGKVVSLQGWTP